MVHKHFILYRFITSIALLCISTSIFHAYAQVLIFERDKTLGGNATDQMRTVYELSDYNILMGGTTQSAISGELTDANNGGADYWVVVLDSATFIPLWNKTYGGSNDDYFSQLKLLSDGNYLVAGYSKSNASGDKTQASKGGWDYWVVKIDPNGVKIWDKTFGGSGDDILCSVDESWDGGLILGGYSNSDISGDKSENSRGGNDYWVVKTDVNGVLQWDKTYGGSGEDTLRATLSHNVQQKYLLAGYSNSPDDGDKSVGGIGIIDYWAIQIDENGNKIWDKTYGGSQTNVLSAAELGLTDNGYLLVGYSNSNAGNSKSQNSKGGYDYWAINTDSMGNIVWDKTIGGNIEDYATAVILTIEGAHVIGGYSNSDPTGDKTMGTLGGFDYWLVKVDSTGSILYNYDYGGFDNDFLFCLSQSCSRGLYVGGESFSSATGTKTETNRGISDYWLLKLVSPTIPLFDFQIGCVKMPTLFYDLSESLPDYWYWTFDDPASGADNSSYLKEPSHTFNEPGIYDVTLVVKEGCQGDTSITKQVEILENHFKNDIDIGEETILCEGDIMELSVKYDPTFTYLWSTGATTNSIFITEPDSISVTVSDSLCSFTDGIFIGTCPRIFTPNIFSPDGDGSNDYFYVYGIGITEIELTVFDRWGQKIYQSSGLDQGWDGTLNGHQLPIDTYIYRVSYKGTGNTPFKLVGDISLIR